MHFRYTWEGTARLKQTIDRLKYQDLSQPCKPDPPAAGVRGSDRAAQASNSTSAAVIAERKEKSLGLLAQRFVQMLLCVTDGQAVALEDAAKSLLGALLFAHAWTGDQLLKAVQTRPRHLPGPVFLYALLCMAIDWRWLKHV